MTAFGAVWQVKLVSLENRYDKLSDDLWGEETGTPSCAGCFFSPFPRRHKRKRKQHLSEGRTQLLTTDLSEDNFGAYTLYRH